MGGVRECVRASARVCVCVCVCVCARVRVRACECMPACTCMWVQACLSTDKTNKFMPSLMFICVVIQDKEHSVSSSFCS